MNWTILLIDDDDAANFIHRIIIEDSPFDVHIKECLKAKQGLNYINKVGEFKNEDITLPKLILLDINMPEMNGWDFLEEFKEVSEEIKSQIVIIMLTTSMNPEDRTRSEKIKAVSGFYNKPLTDKILQEIIKKHFPKIPLK